MLYVFFRFGQNGVPDIFVCFSASLSLSVCVPSLKRFFLIFACSPPCVCVCLHARQLFVSFSLSSSHTHARTHARLFLGQSVHGSFTRKRQAEKKVEITIMNRHCNESDHCTNRETKQ